MRRRREAATDPRGGNVTDSRTSFEQERAEGLGSTDSAAILGLSPYGGPFAVYQAKVGEAPTVDPSLPMWLGLKLERTIAELFSERTGKKVRRSNLYHKHPVWPFLRSHIDYRVVGEPAVLELKTSRGTEGWGEDMGSEIPVHYWIQVQHQLMVLGMPYAYVAALFGHYDFRVYTIARDFDFTDKLAASLVEFWENHVAKGIPPALDGSSRASEILRRRYPADTEPAIPPTPEQAALVDELIAVRSSIAPLEARDAALVNQIKDLIGTRAGLSGLVSWKKNKPSRPTDWEAVAETFRPLVSKSTWDETVALHTTEKEGTRPFLLLKKDKETSDGAAISGPSPTA